MNAKQLKDWLVKIPDDAEIDIMLEVIEPEKIQYQFPANDFAYSKSTNTIIIMHEKFNGEDL